MLVYFWCIIYFTLTLPPYIKLYEQAPAEHVLSAAIMSAPAAMAIAKLGLPETEESQTKNFSEVNLSKGYVGISDLRCRSIVT